MNSSNDLEKKNGSGKEVSDAKDEIVVTKHAIILGGKEVPYTVTCGRIVLKEETEKNGTSGGESEGEKPKASIFFVAYSRDDVKDKTLRPLTFSFNGGPGSSSVWLHLGLLGPRRVLLDEEGIPLPPPYRLVDNEYTLLEQTDLVFIDPVSTGYSRAAIGETAKQFHGFQKDIESIGDFVRLYTTRYKRWTSPKFLIGESYGTTRAAGLSGYLQSQGYYLNGIMLISTALNFQTLDFDPGNDLPYLLFLPTYAATAWYHHQLPTDLQEQPLQEVLREVERFVVEEYSISLLKGSALSPAEKQAIANKLARYTGISSDFILRADLRISIFRFTKELLRHERRSIGRLDTRFKGIDRDSVGERFEHDPSMSAIMGPYTATLYDYVRSDLRYESDLPYEILTPRVRPWSYAEFEGQYVSVAETLRKAISVNPHLKVYVANGFFDLATPYFATDYVFHHLGLDPSLLENLRTGYYEAGHMMYIHIPSLAKLKSDLVDFIQWAIP